MSNTDEQSASQAVELVTAKPGDRNEHENKGKKKDKDKVESDDDDVIFDDEVDEKNVMLSHPKPLGE
jgi:hypothetical protein